MLIYSFGSGNFLNSVELRNFPHESVASKDLVFINTSADNPESSRKCATDFLSMIEKVDVDESLVENAFLSGKTDLDLEGSLLLVPHWQQEVGLVYEYANAEERSPKLVVDKIESNFDRIEKDRYIHFPELVPESYRFFMREGESEIFFQDNESSVFKLRSEDRNLVKIRDGSKIVSLVEEDLMKNKDRSPSVVNFLESLDAPLQNEGGDENEGPSNNLIELYMTDDEIYYVGKNSQKCREIYDLCFFYIYKTDRNRDGLTFLTSYQDYFISHNVNILGTRDDRLFFTVGYADGREVGSVLFSTSTKGEEERKYEGQVALETGVIKQGVSTVISEDGYFLDGFKELTSINKIVHSGEVVPLRNGQLDLSSAKLRSPHKQIYTFDTETEI